MTIQFSEQMQKSGLVCLLILSALIGCTGNSENPSPTKAASQPETGFEKELNTGTGEAEPVTSPDTNSIEIFHKRSEELFIFKKNGKTGFVNRNGDWVIQPKYENAYPFMDGLALVTLDKKNILIDINGRHVPLPEGVTDVSMFKAGLAPVTINGKTGFINRTGKIVTEPVLDFTANDIAQPSEGMRMVVYDSLFTFVDSTGKIIRKPGFEYALDFFEGVALVSNRGKYGYMDKAGKISIPMIYDLAWSFSEGLALVGIIKGKEVQFSFIDRSGSKVFDVPYKLVNPRFAGGLTFFGIENDGKMKFGFIDRAGRVKIEPLYDKVEEKVSASTKDAGKMLAFITHLGEKRGLVSGEVIIKPAFSKISAFYEGLAVASIGDGENQKFGYINPKGNWVIKPEFDESSDFSNGLAAVRKGPLIGGKWGFVDAKGKTAIDFQFQYAYNFLGDRAIVQTGNNKALIDNSGRILMQE